MHMPGELYTELYVQPDARLPDDKRARFRIAVLFREARLHAAGPQISRAIEGRLGVQVHWGWETPKLEEFVRECSVHDLLNTITLVYRVLMQQRQADTAKWWLQSVNQIFAQQHLTYEVDMHGTVHPAVDREFQRNRTSTIATLGASARYANSLTLFERVSSELTSTPPNYKEGWRAAFASAEGLFRLMFPRASRLTADQVAQWLRPAVERLYSQDQTALRAALKQTDALSDWAASSHNYRHEPGSAEPAQPPGDLAILAVSQSAAFIRWLVGIDAELQKRGNQQKQ
jgi:hypothetical protein